VALQQRRRQLDTTSSRSMPLLPEDRKICDARDAQTCHAVTVTSVSVVSLYSVLHPSPPASRECINLDLA